MLRHAPAPEFVFTATVGLFRALCVLNSLGPGSGAEFWSQLRDVGQSVLRLQPSCKIALFWPGRVLRGLPETAGWHFAIFSATASETMS